MNAALLLLSLIACTGTNKDSDETTAGTSGTEGSEGTDTTDGTDPGSDGTETTEGTDSEGTSATDGSGDTDATDGTDPETTCGGIQAQYDLYAAVTACSQPSDCQVLNGQCWTGLGGCYMVVNNSINQSELDVLGQAWNAEGCGGGACKCAVAADVDCVSNVCQFVVTP
jgi:hypothetical protein